MIIYNKNKKRPEAGKVDTDIIGFNISPDDDIEHIIEYLISSLITKCLMEHGTVPEILD